MRGTAAYNAMITPPGQPRGGERPPPHDHAASVPRSKSQGEAAPAEGMVLAESQLAAILGIAEDAVIIVDTRQRIRFFNQGAERVFGYSSGELIG